MQAQLHQVQLELDSVRTALDEESAARSDAEHKLSLANTEISQWKSKFDAEVAVHHEEVEDLRLVLFLFRPSAVAADGLVLKICN